ncbi:cytochrome c oxidase subunit 3 [Chromohalobacter israelensis]|uniref:cytochrome c oxidase subunit 3 n=1 Tax=Chromohalobacter israelensis TaxID=141390 RepID=UPI000FFF08D8|nr:cytochrome c oxidase subunit 3 [Chromohalobacter salexigens]RXE47046.1 cytochrome o ubiquinol oxidase subunit III [Chromohalobacter salexigens]
MTSLKNRHPGINLGDMHEESGDDCEILVFGFWVFMMSDLIIFALLFATYIVMLGGVAGGPGPHELFEIKIAFGETLVLLTSSFTMGMAALALKYRQSMYRLVVWLVISLLLGVAFIGLEWYDFQTMADKGGVPSRSGFLSAFYALLSLHGLHVAGASLWLLVLLGQLVVYGLDTGVKTGLLRLGILWHFLDIVWVGIFSVVYLGGLV